MAIIKCKMCGGDLEVTAGQSVARCEYCDSTQTIPSADNEKKLTLFARANRLRIGCEFDRAAGVYEAIVADFPEEAEAYWGLVLCKYGIEYVDDPATGKKIPTCHRSSFDSVMDDPNYDMAMEYFDVVARRVNREEAKVIEGIRKGIIEVSGREEPYDIFICYKETAPDGQRTLDSVLAQDVYDALTAKGYRVFFSRITLEDKLGQEYEPYIFAALNSAKVMLVFGTDYEYFSAVWVKNEWSRYLQLMAKDKERHLIPCYKGIDAYDMPKEFQRLQSQDLGKIGAIQDLMRGIEKLMPRQNPQPVSQTANLSPLMQRGNIYLEDGEFQQAINYFDRALDEDPRCSAAYLGKAMAKLHLTSLDAADLPYLQLSRDNDFQRACRYATGAEKKALEELEAKGYICQLMAVSKQIIRIRLREKVEREAKEERLRKERERQELLDQQWREQKARQEQRRAVEEEKARQMVLERERKAREEAQRKQQQQAQEVAWFQAQKIAQQQALHNQRVQLQQNLYQAQNALAAMQQQRSKLGLFDGKKKKELDWQISQQRVRIRDMEQRLKSL